MKTDFYKWQLNKKYVSIFAPFKVININIGSVDSFHTQGYALFWLLLVEFFLPLNFPFQKSFSYQYGVVLLGFKVRVALPVSQNY